MTSIILFQPEIPPNTGNIIRLCANIGAELHLIKPLGFSLEDKHLQRAGLDYHDLTHVYQHDSLDDCLVQIHPARLFALSTKGKTLYTEPTFETNDAFLFGAESKGLPPNLLAKFSAEHLLTLPQAASSRSLNLSNAVAIVAYEAWRQLQFIGARHAR